MTWLTSLPAVVLVAGGLVLALLATLGGRLAVRALVPATEREAAYTIAAPLMAALGALFALFMGLTLASEASFLASAQGIVSNEAADASRLAWAATSPGVDTAPIQSALLDYLQATRSNEWSGVPRPTARIPPPCTPSRTWKTPSGPRRPGPSSGHPRAPNCWPPWTP